MEKHISANEAAKEWGISQRRVSILCNEGRVLDAEMVGNMWVIPKNAQKPADARTTRYIKDTAIKLKPFLKWAGGKGQLLTQIRKRFPIEMENNITKYVEPFVGGGAVLFDLLSNYNLEEVYIYDTNIELMNVFKIIKNDVDFLIERLSQMQNDYLKLDINNRKQYYLSKRKIFNELIANGTDSDNLEKAALFIYLNKTCFNGLYRVNSKGQFNVPMGIYKKPLICDENNLINISDCLQNVEIICGDYRESALHIDENTLVYIDPPYRPITKTSFTAYTDTLFSDEEHKNLAKFVDQIDKKGAKIIVSNSDPKNVDPNDNFFDTLYEKYNITRIEANRMINSKAEGRGKVSELLITNF